MIQEFLYKVLPPGGQTVDETVQSLVPPAKSLMANNRFVAGIRIDIEEEHLELWLTLKGHDRWWNKRRVPYLIMAVITGAGLTRDNVEFQRIEDLPNLKSARFWTSGERNKGNRIFMPADGSDPPAQKNTRPCKACQQPAPLFENRSGWHQRY